MKRPLLFLLLLWPAVLPAQESAAQDVLFLKNGTYRPGKVIGFDDRIFRLQVALVPGQPAATVTVPRSDVAHVQFAAAGPLESLAQAADPARLTEIARAWNEQERFLAIPKSPAAAVGITYGNLLLQTRRPEDAARSLEIITQIEKNAWDANDRALAKQVKLRAMVATGQAQEAIGEAVQLARESEDPEILIEAKYILAQAAESQLRKLQEDNPRWQEDVLVRPERNRLVNEAIDLYLYPYLFFGSDTQTAARGLWGAVGIYRYIGETHNALESSRDVVALYADTSFAKLAGEYIASLPPEITEQDHEKDAQNEP